MKTLKTLCIASLVLLTFSCSSDDDSGSQQQQTTIELLTSGKWYLESKSPGSYSDCEKKSYIQFKDNGDFIITSFDDNSGTCETTGAVTAAYTLTNDVNIHIVLGTDMIDAVIDDISDDELTITTDEGETQVFDKTEG